MSGCKAVNCYKERNSCYYTDYCSYHRECLDKLFGKTDNIWYDNVWEIETFETWFNGNCGYVITYNRFSSILCSLYIIIYEPMGVSLRNENMAVIKHGWGFSSKSGAGDKARELKSKLQSNDFHGTPMLKVHSDADYYRTFDSLITSPYVVKENWYHKITEPSLYFKPLDIAKVDEGDFKHVGVYMGNDLVCHFTKKYNGVRIHSWSVFLESYHKGNGTITRYHPIIPFKYFRKIARQIGWTREREFREDNYSLADRNCEHFANMIVYGINYSEQIEDNKDLIIAKNIGVTSLFPLPSLIFNNYSINNGKGSTIKLTNEMSETNDKLGWKTNDRSEAIERRYLQEVPAKEPCQIM